MEHSSTVKREQIIKEKNLSNLILGSEQPEPDKIFEEGSGITRPLKLFIFDLILESEVHCRQLNDRAKFIKFYLQEKESKYWNVFIFEGPLFGKRCSASDNKYFLFRYKTVFYLIWFTRL